MTEEKLKLFISYSHKDEDEYQCITRFKTHIAPLERKGIIDVWYDDDIIPGDHLDSEICDNLKESDIVCLLMSANYIASDYCIKEKNIALELKEKKGTSVINIILSECAWEDEEDIYKLRALPKDANPILSSDTPDKMWKYVYDGLKRTIEQKIKIKQLKLKEEFCEKFLRDTEMLTKAHSQKEKVILEDIFVYPELEEYDFVVDAEERINSKELIEKIFNYPKLVIAGEAQSGKTTFSKILFRKFYENNFVPIYIQDKKNLYKKDIEKLISRSFIQQYEGVDLKEIDPKRIIPIIDDFHYARNKERYIKDLSKYNRCIIIVDDIFNINIKDETLIGTFSRFKINEFKPSLRYELIDKWVKLTDRQINDPYKDIDKKTNLINNILGKTIGSGIMPAYPFFVLTAIVTYDTFEIDKEITSQGYCYQALIYFYLRKQGVKNDEIDIYLNFLTEFAYYVYKERKSELKPDEFESFLDSYSEKYILPIEKETLLDNLNPIIIVDGCNNYSFQHLYLYYFFVAKYLAEHIEDSEMKEEIGGIMENLHVDENAYITIFISHHSRNAFILEKIDKILVNLFKKYEPATLTNENVAFFDEQADLLVDAVMPHSSSTVESERQKRLDIEDEIEESNNHSKEKEEDFDNDLQKDLRRAIKTSEVVGCIIKNRSGSLTKSKIEYLFKETTNLHLRILSSYFELIKDEEGQKTIIDILSERLKNDIETSDETETITDEEIKKRAKWIFWNLSFLIVYSIIFKIIHSLGSDKLTLIVNEVCDEIDTPASFIVKHGILMWYNKNPQLDEIAEKINDGNFSMVSNRIIRFMVVNYSALHLNHGDRRRIRSKLGIPVSELLKEKHNKKIESMENK